ncbi:methyltransferase-like protein 25B [Ylistrum balloti]|uniref:methyltransferase-like protein 25B n=1 Tax=Ylistrum balloti TaxID=509963 RepID=UPI002905A4F6|nr:methyltransferase-like protein 25B [Ylistrum balloti]
MNLRSCDSNTIKLIKQQVEKLVKFINAYRWIINAYISDFFTDGQWDRLPEGWRDGLSQLDPPDLAFLLDCSLPVPNRKDLPLTLLAFRESTHALSLCRKEVDLEHDTVGEGLFTADPNNEKKIIVSPYSDVTTQKQARADIKCGQYLPLNACFRANVKPKKQHEILQLGKAIQLLGGHCHCEHVVDVGAGKGHLSRLLAFGYGFKVTTVEAADSHAPKAKKIDKAIQKKIHRKLKRKLLTDQDQGTDSKDSIKEDLSAINKTSLPDHVTCVIQPGTSADQFLEIVKDSYKKQSNCLNYDGVGKLPNENPSNLYIESELEDSEHCSNHCVSKKNSFRDGVEEDARTRHQEESDDKLIGGKSNPSPKYTTADVDLSQLRLPPDDLSESRSPVPSDELELNSRLPDDLSHFLLTGLHACGDLTPTMLRIFAQCQDVVGVASVACCYMKLSCTREGGMEDSSSDVGYPMSQFTRNLSDSYLSFEAREMACHFADSYKERLIANPPNLKMHCYRAALQYIIRQIQPDFIQGSVRLTTKYTENLSFESYVKNGLQRLGLDYTSVPVQVMQQAESYLPYWQNVVAFYTLRLSLGPVVESLILLDRMLFLYEQGIPSVLLPIFDPALSPRNFVLLALRNISTGINNS